MEAFFDLPFVVQVLLVSVSLMILVFGLYQLGSIVESLRNPTRATLDEKEMEKVLRDPNDNNPSSRGR